MLREQGLAWDRLADFLQLRAELCELEIRFSRLGCAGLFRSLDRAGHLRHALGGITSASIEEATQTPPARGRAGVRGRLIRELNGIGRYGADWDAVWDFAGRRIDLSDPWAEGTPAWTPAPRRESAFDFEMLQLPLEDVHRAYDRGEYDRAWSLLAAQRSWRHRAMRATLACPPST